MNTGPRASSGRHARDPARGTPAGFPADDLYAFRLTALGTQLVLWATIAVVFARLADRLLDRTPSAGLLRHNERADTGWRAVR